jgi:hypothetical protein
MIATLRRLAADRRFDDLAGLKAGGAYADALVSAIHAGAHRTQVHVPAAAAHVVSVADLISKLRAFAADVANLCHSIDSRYLTQKGLRASGLVVKGKFYRKIAPRANRH